MIEIPKSNAREQQENELASWVLDKLKQETKCKSYSEPMVAAQEIGLAVCQMRSGTHRLLKR